MTVLEQIMSTPSRVESWAHEQARGYQQDTDETRPMGGYLGAMGVYAAAVTGLAALSRGRGRHGPEAVTPWDVVLLGLATHKLSRTIAKDAVTSPVRAPFVEYEEPSGDAEVAEDVRFHGGPRHAVGELITCPFCLAQWVSTAFVAGWVLAPRAARLAAATFAGVAVSDYLQLGYAALQKVSAA